MTTYNYLRARGFTIAKGEQPVGASDYVANAGIFWIHVRVPLVGYEIKPALWVGYAAGGSPVELQSHVKYRDVAQLVEDAVALRRTLRGY